jgi:predicted TIM-barrel fold metal-dependent hydrolase
MTFETMLELPEMVLIGDATKRMPQPRRAWAPGTRIISADSHFLEGDIWVDHFPEALRDTAPRMFFRDGGWHTTIKGKDLYSDQVAREQCGGSECVPGMSDVAARLRDLDAEGIEKELLFPQRLIALYVFGDLEYRELVFGAYNRHMARVRAEAPDRLFFAGMVNYWDPQATRDSIAELKELGASALMVPVDPKNDANGDRISWAKPNMAPFWAAVEESGLPLCFHIGEKATHEGLGALGAYVLTAQQGLRSTWGALTFGGVFDRHPGLKVVFAEGGIGWIAAALHDADVIYSSFISTMEPKLEHSPSRYWHRNCYASFMVDPVGLRLLDMIGADRVMWSSDYPHREGTFGYSSSAIAKVFEATSVENAQLILGKTALALFGME